MSRMDKEIGRSWICVRNSGEGVARGATSGTEGRRCASPSISRASDSLTGSNGRSSILGHAPDSSQPLRSGKASEEVDQFLLRLLLDRLGHALDHLGDIFGGDRAFIDKGRFG